VSPTSLIDVLLVMVVFLLTTFHAPDDCGCLRPVRVPIAENACDILDTPVVTVTSGQVLVDGAPAGEVRTIEQSARIQRVDALFHVLTAKRLLWMQTHPREPFAGTVLLQLDEHLTALVVKSVFHTSALSGYPNVSFMVRSSS